jgi:UDP-3-O-[3-hydroxymyristoyl] N-acetylglucosamine deacetylase
MVRGARPERSKERRNDRMGNEAQDLNTSGGPTVLIVDDEPSICRSIEAVLRDEGFRTITAPDGEEGLEILKTVRPALVLLDIWLPGMDGVETLRRIKELYEDLPVVMVSGHATIATAMSTTRQGATDFLEKPVDMHTLLEAVRTAIKRSPQPAAAAPEPSESRPEPTVSTNVLNRVVFSDQKMRGRALRQKTLAHSALLYGQGLHSGKKSGLILEPLPPNSGIHFVGLSQSAAVPAHVSFVESTGFATALRLGQTRAGTIEHLMSALHAYGVSNLLVKCNGEVPVMDGSALEFCTLLEEVGLEEQEGAWYEIAVDRPLSIGTGDERISCEPADTFTIEYTLRYPEPVGEQHFVFTLDGPESFKREIAPARTFSMVRDIGKLQSQGLAQGGRFDNFVMIGAEGAVNDNFRFANEPVRHKILDAIGDLYLLGRPLRCKIVARLTGHSDNINLLKLIHEAMG